MNPNFLPTEFVLPLPWERARSIIVDRQTRLADAINTREIAQYEPVELINGQHWFNTSSSQSNLAFRKVIVFGALPNTGTKSVAHGITGIVAITKLYAGCTDTAGTYISLPYAGSDPIEIYADNTNVTVVTLTNRSNFTICYVVMEYLKN